MPSCSRRKLVHDSAKVCGSCRYLRRLIHYSQQLEEACEKVGKGVNVHTEDLTLLDFGFEYVCDMNGAKIFRKRK